MHEWRVSGSGSAAPVLMTDGGSGPVATLDTEGGLPTFVATKANGSWAHKLALYQRLAYGVTIIFSEDLSGDHFD